MTATTTAYAYNVAANGAIYRTFDISESSAIYNLHVERGNIITGMPGFVEVIYQSNTEKAYGFTANPEFVMDLIEIISWKDCKGISLGRLIHQAKQNGNLESIEVAD